MKKSKVKKLNQGNFKSDVIDSKNMWMIKFYAPWCYPCQRLAPIWEKSAKRMQGIINFGEVDCTKEVELSTNHNIKRFPTIKFFYKNHRAIYKGGRTCKSIVNYAIRKKLNKGKPLKSNKNKPLKKKQKQ